MATDFAKEALKASANGGGAFIIGGDFNEPSHLDWTEATRSVSETCICALGELSKKLL